MPSEYAQHFPNELVPVRALEFDAEQNADLALQVEITENEKRRDYTPAEVKVLAEKLKSAGYVDTNGRPALGEKPLRPALKVIIGKSIRTIQRYLNEDREKSTTDVVLFSSTNALKSLKSHLLNWQKSYGGSDDEIVNSIEQDVVELLKKLEINSEKP